MSTPTNENEEERKENIENPDDSFGLPEIDYEPLKREEPDSEQDASFTSTTDASFTPPDPILEVPTPPIQERTDENAYYEPNYNYTYEDERPPIWPKILLVLALLIAAGGLTWYLMSYRPKQIELEARRDREKAAAAEAEEQRRLAEQAAREREEASQAQPEAPAALPAGTIETLTSRSGKYYVVVASSIDGDLIMDYAKKLSEKGVTSHIIPPYGKVQFHRLAVADGDTYANAQATADGMKGGDYGNGLWVLKY